MWKQAILIISMIATTLLIAVTVYGSGDGNGDVDIINQDDFETYCESTGGEIVDLEGGAGLGCDLPVAGVQIDVCWLDGPGAADSDMYFCDELGSPIPIGDAEQLPDIFDSEDPDSLAVACQWGFLTPEYCLSLILDGPLADLMDFSEKPAEVTVLTGIPADFEIEFLDILDGSSLDDVIIEEIVEQDRSESNPLPWLYEPLTIPAWGYGIPVFTDNIVIIIYRDNAPDESIRKTISDWAKACRDGGGEVRVPGANPGDPEVKVPAGFESADGNYVCRGGSQDGSQWNPVNIFIPPGSDSTATLPQNSTVDEFSSESLEDNACNRAGANCQTQVDWECGWYQAQLEQGDISSRPDWCSSSNTAISPTSVPIIPTSTPIVIN